MSAHRASAVLTPVGDDGLDALELGRPLGRFRELQLLELCWSDAGHGGGICGGGICGGGVVVVLSAKL